MERKDILRRLEERLARGEISEATYLGIKARYAAEQEEAVSPETAVPSFGPEIGETIARATEVAARATGEAMRAVGGAFRGMEISGIGGRSSRSPAPGACRDSPCGRGSSRPPGAPGCAGTSTRRRRRSRAPARSRGTSARTRSTHRGPFGWRAP